MAIFYFLCFACYIQSLNFALSGMVGQFAERLIKDCFELVVIFCHLFCQVKFSILFAFCLDHFVSFRSNISGNKLLSNLALFIKQIVLLKLFFFALLFCPDHTFKICLKQFENNIQDLAKEIILIILEGRTIIFVENFLSEQYLEQYALFCSQN